MGDATDHGVEVETKCHGVCHLVRRQCMNGVWQGTQIGQNLDHYNFFDISRHVGQLLKSHWVTYRMANRRYIVAVMVGMETMDA